MTNKRSRARQYALQALYQWQLTGQDVGTIEGQFLADEALAKADVGLFVDLLRGVPGKLREGGRLQALAIGGQASQPTHNWGDSPDIVPDMPVDTRWIDLDNVDPVENDLRLRGAGELLGTRQSGMPTFRIADVEAHGELLQAARDDAALILNKDPERAAVNRQTLQVVQEQSVAPEQVRKRRY